MLKMLNYLIIVCIFLAYDAFLYYLCNCNHAAVSASEKDFQLVRVLSIPTEKPAGARRILRALIF